LLNAGNSNKWSAWTLAREEKVGTAGKLRILVVTSDKYPPFRPAAKAIFGEELASRGHRIDWLMPTEEGTTVGRSCEFGSGTAYLAPASSPHTRLGRLVKYVREFFNDLLVFRLARRNRYDVIQVKDKYIAAVFALIAARLSGSKFCFWLAYPHPESNLYNARMRIARYPWFYWFRGHYQSLLLYRLLLPNADHVFVQSEQMRADIAQKGIDPAKMTPVPGSLNFETIPYNASADPGPAGSQVLYTGTLLRKRRLDFVIRAFARVITECPDAQLVFVGSGENLEDEEMLQQEVRNCALDEHSVRFVGRVPMKDVWQYIEAASVCLSPYYPTFVLNSTSPTKLVEYMAMARPVVANEHPEQSAVIAESGAGHCVPWDEQAFAAAIIDLLRHPDKAREMGRNGCLWAWQHRSNRTMADLVESQYLRVRDTAVSEQAAGPQPRGEL
jgi:glycosyltransferase involved in cell wall biosynthesis